MSFVISVLLVAASLPISRPIFAGSDTATFTRVFNDPIRAVFIENQSGPIDVRTTPSASVSIKATRIENIGTRVESEVIFEQPDRETLRIIANPDSLFRPITLAIQVPSSVQLSVKGGSQRVSVRGSVSSLTLETDSGNVALYLPEKTDTELSLRTIRGVVESRLPLTIFGQSDSRRLDAKIGKGGSPLIARSQRGNISLLPYSDGQSIGQIAESEKTEVISGEKSISSLTSKSDSNTLAGDHEVSAENPIKLEARLVNLNVKVADANGKTLPSLKKENF